MRATGQRARPDRVRLLAGALGVVVSLLLALSLVGPPPASAAAAPTVTAVSPATGTMDGGTAIAVTGTGFVAGATVTVGGGAATAVTVVSATQITATTAAGTVGLAVVAVTNADGQAGTLSGAFSYLGPPPTVATIVPNSGGSLSGTTVTITGTNYLAGAAVTIGGVAATSVVVVSPTQITAVTPVRTAGSADVVVTNTDAQLATLVAGYSFVASSPPTVSAASPATGSTGGGTPLTLTGTGFASGATVLMGAAAATGVVVVSATQISALAPAGTAGAVTIAVTNADTQSGALAAAFTYVASAAPTVTAVTPASGAVAGGTVVTITGSGFNAGATVKLGSVAATAVTVVGSTQLVATTPASAAGVATVTVTNTDAQTATLASAFSYNAAPKLTSLTPALGGVAGGTVVTLAGSGFLAGATVSFGGVAGTALTVDSATSITVTSADAQQASLSSGFTYKDAPAITAVIPAVGTVAGGTMVTITGSGFVTGVSVKIGGTAATSVIVIGANVLTAVTPAGQAGAVNVEVAGADSLGGTLSAGFLYLAAESSTEGQITAGSVPAEGVGLIVFGGGTTDQLVAAAVASGCASSDRLSFYATAEGRLVPYIPITLIAIVNAEWEQLFPSAIPAGVPMIAICQ